MVYVSVHAVSALKAEYAIVSEGVESDPRPFVQLKVTSGDGDTVSIITTDSEDLRLIARTARLAARVLDKAFQKKIDGTF